MQSVIPVVTSTKSAAHPGWCVRACYGVIAGGLLTLTACEADVPKSPVLQRIESALSARKSFTVAEAEVPGVIFYCVCGPYTNCDEKSKTLADELGYERPFYKFHRLYQEQSVLLFKRDEIIEVKVDRTRFWVADEHEEFCSTDTNMTIPRSG